MPISREQAEALIQEQLINTIQQDTPKSSVFMGMARKLPNMTSKQTRMPVLDMLPMAYWVNGDMGFKQTSEQAWDNVYLTAAELAVIVPIPEAVLDDASFDILGEVQPRVVEAIGQRVDSAVIFGINRPSDWDLDIISRARQAGNNVSVASNPDYYDLIMGENGVISKVEEDGYMATGVISGMGMRAKLRGLKTEYGQPIFKTDMQGSTQYALDGAPMYFPDNGSFDNSVCQMIVGDFKRAVYAIRQDITVKILDQGVIQNPTTKEIVYNLAQQDMIALRVVFRMGWALPNPATRIDEDRVGCPFAYLEPATAVTTRAVTFTVTDNAEMPKAIGGVVVEMNGARLKTNASGIAVFNLRAGTYTAKIKKKGFSTVTETVVVSGAAVSKEITLIAND
ncbi:phage major capsid protein [Anaerotignum propionicum]|uniref:Phage capsid family protein n=1 Tax=Anaerotignum propionicum DSM 1682 TaxID=991789 RepID=A0A110A6X5_ANAPI|nr:phage major capsid protein [Anaerotignum propionicum]AMJ40375.1 phage capsid family protein [Anaerotignum propionicum DSM 1682]SHE43786.1 phage major capsid protein, HK97 family [[Clostridium] propionicum DSM 1682] [Anaerotignum propionicum DSM 1682]